MATSVAHDVTPDSQTPAKGVAALKAELKALQAEKGAIAGQFRNPDLDPAHKDRLKQNMQRISAAVADTQAQLKAALNQNTELPTPAFKPPARLAVAAKNLDDHLQFKLIHDLNDPAWTTFVAHHPLASAYHAPSYLACINERFGHASVVMVAYHRSKVVGGLPVTFMRSALFGKFGVSVPYFNYGGPLSAYRDVTIALIEQARRLLTTENLSYIELRTVQPDLPYPVSQKKVSMILALPDNTSDLDRQLGTKIRAQFKKTENYAPACRFGGEELLDDFYEVFAHNMRDLGTPVYSKRWFRALLRQDSIQGTLAVGYLDDRPISTGFLIGSGDMLEIPWASTLRAGNASNMNMWFYRRILGYAIDRGYAFFDFGRSTKDAGTYRFKKQWGAAPVQHYWYYLSATDADVNVPNPDSAKYRLLIAAWQRLPVWVTRIIGPPIVKNIP